MYKIKEKISISKKLFLLIISYLGLIVCSFFLPSLIEIVLCTGVTLYTSIEVWNGYINKNKKICCYGLVFPIVISCFQNVYLGLAINQLNKLEVQVLLSLHFLFVFMIFVISIFGRSKIKNINWLYKIIIFIISYSLVMFIYKPAQIISFISSIRNLLSCMLFYLIAMILVNSLESSCFYNVFFVIVTVVVLFGFYEYLVGLDVWKDLNISKLWTLKSITLNYNGIPANWYSSEKIAEKQIRRMVSTFADPVNLGTFLFATAMICFYKKKRILFLLVTICSILTVSKGALLGFLIFFVIYAWYKDKNKLMGFLIALVVFVFGLAFIEFSKNSSTGSLFAHIRGLKNSFVQVVEHPFGLGVGNSGVLANLFAVKTLDSSVTETGIGSVIAQLGILGLIFYFIFFLKLIQIPSKWGKTKNNVKIIYYTLLLSFLVNVLFNEVALSPNSCGIYFIELAILRNENENARFSNFKT